MTTKKTASFDDLVADSKPITDTVEVGSHTVTIQELSGADRFALAERDESESRWDMMRWIVLRGMIKPKPENIEALDKLKPEWVVQIATAITALSGMGDDAIEEAENESASVIGIGGS